MGAVCCRVDGLGHTLIDCFISTHDLSVSVSLDDHGIPGNPLPPNSDLRYGVQAQTVGCNFPKVRVLSYPSRYVWGLHGCAWCSRRRRVESGRPTLEGKKLSHTLTRRLIHHRYQVYKMSDRLFVGLSGLATDVQTLEQLLRFRLNMYKLREERDIKPETFSALLSHILYEKRCAPLQQ